MNDATALPELKAETRTAKTLSRSLLPAALKEHLSAHGFRNKCVRVVVFTSDDRALRTENTQWSGGTRNYYAAYHFDCDSFYTCNTSEGVELRPGENCAIVVMSYFQNQNCTPAVYLRAQSVAEFFFSDLLGDDARNLPAAYAADWLEDKAMWEKPRRANKMRKAAEFLRTYFA